MKKTILLILLLTITLKINSLYIRGNDYSKGPLFGKNMYLPFLIYYNFPGVRATTTDNLSIEYHTSTYLIQDFIIYWYNPHTDKGKIAIDYESNVMEFGISTTIYKKLQFGIDTRIIWYYGGFLDNIIETFHHTFGFPNAGRERFARDSIYVDIQNKNGINLFIEGPAFSFGDIDLWVKYSVFQNKFFSFALLGAFKIPTGKIEYLSGSGYPDFATGILMDIKPVWFISLYFQGGIVLLIDGLISEIESNPYPMFNGLFSLEINPLKYFSLLVQFNIKSPPFEGYDNFTHYDFRDTPFFSLPQTNILVGFICQYNDLTWQFYFEEDPFTNAGTDLTLNFTYRQKIKIFK